MSEKTEVAVCKSPAKAVAAQAVCGSIAQQYYSKGNILPSQAFLLAMITFAYYEDLEFGDIEEMIPEMEEDFHLAEYLYDGQPHEIDRKIDIKQVMLDSRMVNEDGTAGAYLTKLWKEKVPFRPSLLVDKVGRRFNYANAPWSALHEESTDILEATAFNNDQRMKLIYREVFDQLPKNHPERLLFWILEGVEAMDTEGEYGHEFKADIVFRVHLATCRGTPVSGDKAGGLYEFQGVEPVKDPVFALALLEDYIRNECGYSYESESELEELIELATDSPVEFILVCLTDDEYDSEDDDGRQPFTFTRVAHLLLEMRAHVNEGGPLPYFGFPVGIDLRGAGVQHGAILSNDVELMKATGLWLSKVQDVYLRSADYVREATGITITRDGMKSIVIPVLYGLTGYGLSFPGSIKSVSSFNAIAEKLDADPEIFDKVAKAVNASLGKIHTRLRKVMENASWDWGNEDIAPHSKINKPVAFETGDGCLVKVDHRVEVNLADVVMQRVPGEDPVDAGDVRINLPSGVTCYFKKPTLETEIQNWRKYGRDALVNLLHSIDSTIMRMVVVMLAARGVKCIKTAHDCYYVDINSYHILEEVIMEVYELLFGQEGNFPSEMLPKGTDLVKLYYKGLKESLIVKSDVTGGTTQYFAYEDSPTGKGKVGGINRLLRDGKKPSKVRRGEGFDLVSIIRALKNPIQYKSGKNSRYAG